MSELYFQDFAVGQTFESVESVLVTAAEIHAFAEKYDPQAFHLDPVFADQSFFQGLAASGWQTAGIAMRLRVLTIRVSGGMVGAGVDEIRWKKPVRAGDTLRSTEDVLATRRLASRPQFGMVRTTTTVYNQQNEVVMTAVVNFLAPVRM